MYFPHFWTSGFHNFDMLLIKLEYYFYIHKNRRFMPLWICISFRSFDHVTRALDDFGNIIQRYNSLPRKGKSCQKIHVFSVQEHDGIFMQKYFHHLCVKAACFIYQCVYSFICLLWHSHMIYKYSRLYTYVCVHICIDIYISFRSLLTSIYFTSGPPPAPGNHVPWSLGGGMCLSCPELTPDYPSGLVTARGRGQSRTG